jgi:hypothetical protein
MELDFSRGERKSPTEPGGAKTAEHIGVIWCGAIPGHPRMHQEVTDGNGK